MSNTEILANIYEKLNPENQSYALGILQTLKYAQDVLIKKQSADLAQKDRGKMQIEDSCQISLRHKAGRA